MERRGFLKALGIGLAGIVGASVIPDPDRLLWIPGAKTFFLPSVEPIKIPAYWPEHPRPIFLTRDVPFEEFSRLYMQPAVAELAVRIDANAAKAYDDVLRGQGWASSMLKKGDVFTIGGVYAVNPISRRRTDQLEKFVVKS